MGHSHERFFQPSRQELREQKIQKEKFLGKITTVEQRLRDPEFPESIKGLEGLKIADEILKQRNSKGVLIGGLAKEIWTNNNTVEDLEKHKDVDILVLDKNFKLEKNFEAGIDWWLPKQIATTEDEEYETRQEQKEYWQNGGGAVLAFYINSDYEFKKSSNYGLYLPSKDFVKDVKWEEIKTVFDYYNHLTWVKPHLQFEQERMEKNGEYYFKNDLEKKESLDRLKNEATEIEAEINKINEKFLKDTNKEEFESIYSDIKNHNELRSEFKSSIKLNYLLKDISHYFKSRIDSKKQLHVNGFKGKEFYNIKKQLSK